MHTLNATVLLVLFSSVSVINISYLATIWKYCFNTGVYEGVSKIRWVMHLIDKMQGSIFPVDSKPYQNPEEQYAATEFDIMCDIFPCTVFRTPNFFLF